MVNCRIAFTLVLTLGLASVTGGQSTPAFDWPQWRGPDRNGVSKETGLLKQWPASGPRLVWSTSSLGAGYGSVSVSGTRIFVQGLNGPNSTVFSLNRADGKPVWSKTLGSASKNEKGPGPRGTPTVDGDRVYILTENGDLACLRSQDGSVLWQRNVLKDFGAHNLLWLLSESPLIDGNKVIVSPGGRNAGMVALDKMTGKTIWTTKELSDEAGYGSAIAADVQGIRTLMTQTAEAGVGVRASDGKLMWRYKPAPNNTAMVGTPIFSKDKVFYTGQYLDGGALLALTVDGGEVKGREIYRTRALQNLYGGVVLVEGYLYGFHNAFLTCLEFETGKVMWRDRSVGEGSVTYADGNLYILGQDNIVALAEVSPKGYREKGRFRIADQGWPTRAHPVVSGGRLYIRNQGTVESYDIRAR